MFKKFPTELKKWKYIIERIAKRAGLDFFETIFEMVDFDQMNELAAYGGFPVRYSHWTFGQDYEEQSKKYDYGLQKIYEMVINNDPAIAYLMQNNMLIDQKIVIAHVYGHVDFFKNNIWFQAVPRKALDRMASHRYQIEAIKEKIGVEKVDDFLDKLLSVDWLIDDHSLMIKRNIEISDSSKEENCIIGKIKTQDAEEYMERWLNPSEYLKEQRDILENKKQEQIDIERGFKIPVEPTRDILLFLIQRAPLENWKKEIISIIREENYYYVPQAQTKIMNEGWATFWHEEILSRLGVADRKEIFDFASHASGILKGPYKLGYELFKDIEYRWDTARHGRIYEECQDREILKRWDEFIIFKTFFDECQGDKGKIQEKWDEFCVWKEILIEGKFNFPKELWLIGEPVRYWLEYLDVEQIINSYGMELEKAKELWRQAMICLNKTKDETSRAKKDKLKDQYEIKKMLAKWDIRFFEDEKRFLKIFLKIKESINRQKFNNNLSSQPIPLSFSAWAEKYPEPVGLGQGRDKIFEVRRDYNDLTFIAEFLTPIMCEKLKFFTFEPGGGGVPDDHWGVVSRQCNDIKKKLLFTLCHRGQPVIELVDANYERKWKLYLRHLFEGEELEMNKMYDVLKILYEFWQKPVILETIVLIDNNEIDFNWPPNLILNKERKKQVGIKKIYIYNGKKIEEKDIGEVYDIDRP